MRNLSTAARAQDPATPPSMLLEKSPTEIQHRENEKEVNKK